jgi:predicted AlkP superfamily phosphohydrolase/phosphomutase
MRRVLVIGLDGATFDVMKPLVAAGRLPCIAGLMQRGVTGSLRSTLPPLTMPAWSSFITGVNPGQHGLVDFIRRQPGSYDYAPVSAADRQAESLWSMVSRQDKRVIVINVPGTYPPESVNGCLVSGMTTPSSATTFTHPPELTAELHRLTGGYRTHTGWAYSRGRVERFVRSVYDTTEVQVQAAKHLMAQQSWDLFVYVFTGTDRLQHGLWHCLDPEHPLHLQDGPNPYRETIPRFYERVDPRLRPLSQVYPRQQLVDELGTASTQRQSWGAVEARHVPSGSDLAERVQRFAGAGPGWPQGHGQQGAEPWEAASSLPLLC